MARKHRSSEQDNPPNQKRARISTQGESHPPTSEDSSDSDYEDDPEQLACDQRVAEQHTYPTGTPGPPRQAGTISKVILVQFMCHRYQVVELGPQVNFVIGHNGSGKSAVLTAITLLLGAKASSTSRGTSLKTFIREGEKKAEVSLHLTNRGDEAFKPDTYGDEIIIERTISKDGSSGFKIKGSLDNRVISTRRDGLQAILDHFMIQADNPLNVLNQDAAKQFLNSSSSKQKYDFFIRGTQLKQLTEEYEEINANIMISRELLSRKKNDLPELLERARTAERNLQAVKEASQAQEKICEIQKELFWIYVAEAKAELDSAAQELHNEEHILPKYEGKVKEMEAKIVALDEHVKAIEAEKATQSDEKLDARRLELLQRHRSLANDIKRLNADIREADSELQKTDQDISEQSRLIDQENAKSLKNTHSSRQGAIERSRQLTTDITALESKLTQIQHDLSLANEAVKTTSDHAAQCDNEVKKSLDEMEKIKRAIWEYGSIQKNRLLLFGQSADKLKQAVESNNSWSEKPIGPLGYYIQVIDKTWQPVLESILGSILGAYMVVNERDEKLLRSIMTNLKCKAPIIRSRRELFDYSGGEPRPEFFTILRALKFKDEHVKRALINDLRIEKSILVEHRLEGDPIMSDPPHLRRNIEACYTRDGFRVGGVDRGRAVRALNMYKGPPRLSQDDGSFIAELNRKASELESKIGQVKQQATVAHEQSHQSGNQLQKLMADERQAKMKLAKAQDMKASVQDDLFQSSSSNISALEDIKIELESARRKLYDQSQELCRQKDRLTSELGTVKAEQESLQQQMNNRQQQVEDLNFKLTEKITQSVSAKEALKHFQQSLAKQTAKVLEAKKNVESAQAKLPEAIKEAQQVSGSDEMIETSRSREDAMAELDTFNKIVKETELRHHKSVEDVELDCYHARANYRNAQKQIKEQAESLQILNAALRLRKECWLAFRNMITSRAKVTFEKYLEKRRYSGRLRFHHGSEKLDIQVNPREDRSTQGRLENPKTLSGGEKSFSTIALLLTLWDAVNCPIRCLDEFDVFMDDVNRRVALKMMMESAQAAHDVQYIFITPNSLSYAQVDDNTKIIKMEDPTRHRGTLASGRQ